ncbi:MAG: IS256 family transposase, partial [Methanospirillum sp.]|nr:IS256 family transposase [Methanospirillum sp.]
ERVTTGGDGRILLVEKKVPERAHPERSIEEWIKVSWGLSLFSDDLAGRGYTRAATTIERFLPWLQNYTAFPKEHWNRIRTTNGMERINKELKRRTRVMGAFPSEHALLRSAGSILRDINEEWVTGKRYLSMEE